MSKEVEEFLESIGVRFNKRTCKKTNKYGSEVVRMNQPAMVKLQQMMAVTKLSKRSLVSYGISLLFDEFTKWRNGDQQSQFGYEMEQKDGES